MTKLDAGTAAKAGYYLNATSWEIHPVPADGELLPGEAGQKWLRIPVLAALVLAPLLGLTFLMFLPFIGFYLTAQRCVQPLLRVARQEAMELTATMSPEWQPGVSHLTGQGEQEKAAGDGEKANPELDALACEIEAKRGEKR